MEPVISLGLPVQSKGLAELFSGNATEPIKQSCLQPRSSSTTAAVDCAAATKGSSYAITLSSASLELQVLHASASFNLKTAGMMCPHLRDQCESSRLLCWQLQVQPTLTGPVHFQTVALALLSTVPDSDFEFTFFSCFQIGQERS